MHPNYTDLRILHEVEPTNHAMRRCGRGRPTGRSGMSREAMWEVIRLGFTADLVLPLLLSYIVPFLVAGYSRLRLLARLGDHGGWS